MDQKSKSHKIKSKENESINIRIIRSDHASINESNFSWVIYSYDGNSISMHTDPNKSVIGNNDFLEEGKENKDLIDFEVNTFGM